MKAGLNLLFDVWRETTPTDDATGGAVFTGTVVYEAVPGSLHGDNPEQLLLQQGLETPRMFTVNLSRRLTIWERDYVQIISPENHPYYQDMFRVVGTKPSSYNQNTYLKVRHIVRAHGIQ